MRGFTLSDDDLDTLRRVRRHLKLIHHVPGRLRLRADMAIFDLVGRQRVFGLERVFRLLPGVTGARLDMSARSLSIRYDVLRVGPDRWSRLLTGTAEEAEAALRAWLAGVHHDDGVRPRHLC